MQTKDSDREARVHEDITLARKSFVRLQEACGGITPTG